VGQDSKAEPLEVKTGDYREDVVMNLVNVLRNIYRDSWGLRDLVKIITDDNDAFNFSKQGCKPGCKALLECPVSTTVPKRFRTFDRQQARLGS
jgi:hypothetical protein